MESKSINTEQFAREIYDKISIRECLYKSEDQQQNMFSKITYYSVITELVDGICAVMRIFKYYYDTMYSPLLLLVNSARNNVKDYTKIPKSAKAVLIYTASSSLNAINNLKSQDQTHEKYSNYSIELYFDDPYVKFVSISLKKLFSSIDDLYDEIYNFAIDDMYRWDEYALAFELFIRKIYNEIYAIESSVYMSYISNSTIGTSTDDYIFNMIDTTPLNPDCREIHFEEMDKHMIDIFNHLKLDMIVLSQIASKINILFNDTFFLSSFDSKMNGINNDNSKKEDKIISFESISKKIFGK